MGKNLEVVAAAIGRDKDVVDKLSQELTGPRDRAYMVCSALECKHNVKGRCTIYTVTNPPERLSGGVCKDYVM
ncbi:MAG: hypothetical protein FD174_1456 [Geobacteraceae bacterium]|nr:MAG: hypothetical protein FD174_1456 [Geobacteraceae bacterium]